MADFADIIDQNQMKEHMQNALSTGKVSHAYIISGENGSGKEYIAKIFAKALQCEHKENKNEYIEACNECHSCVQALSDNHPDIITITHEKPNSIGVDEIREKLRDDVVIRHYESEYKIYIIPEGEKMTQAAQNALLKTLEEPPSYIVIIILTNNINAFLQTIISRCIVLPMKPVKDDSIRKYLMEECHVVDYKAVLCASFARGNVGKARLLAKSEEFDKVKDEALSLLKNIDDMEVNEIVAAIKKINEYKFDVNDYLDIFSIWYRDMLLFKATHDANGLVFREELQYIRRAADKSAYEGIETIIDALEKCKQRLKANVNFDLSMELLLLTIKEN